MSARSIPSLAVLLAFFFVLLAVVSAAPVPVSPRRVSLPYAVPLTLFVFRAPGTRGARRPRLQQRKLEARLGLQQRQLEARAGLQQRKLETWIPELRRRQRRLEARA